MKDLKVKGKRVLLRVDMNVPEQGGHVVDDYRIRRSLPTITALRRAGASRIILLSHRSRPKYGTRLSLAFILPTLAKLLDMEVTFLPTLAGANALINSAQEGGVMLLENLRYDKGEEENNPAFASKLSSFGDVFIQEAFGVLHRKHASTDALARILPSAAGPLVQEEVSVITNLREHPVQPFVAAIGGSKISTKLPLIEILLPQVEGLCLGGALANTVLRAKGMAIGRSLVEEDMLERVQAIELTDTTLHIPIDVIVSRATDGSEPYRVAGVADVTKDELILDIGPDTQKLFSSVLSKARTVFWNGPMGLAEVEEFRSGTEAIARAVAAGDAFSVVGGGDTTMYLSQMGIEDDINFISTGGGAMLKLLAGEELPGLTVLEV